MTAFADRSFFTRLAGGASVRVLGLGLALAASPAFAQAGDNNAPQDGASMTKRSW